MCRALQATVYSQFLYDSRTMTEKAMAPHSSTLAWKILWTEEPGRLQSIGLLGVRQDWVSSLSPFHFHAWRRTWQPTPVFLPGESQARGSLVGCRLWRSHRVRHDWSNLAAAAAGTMNHFLYLKRIVLKMYLFDYVGSQLWHVESSLYHAGSSVEMHGLSSCSTLALYSVWA